MVGRMSSRGISSKLLGWANMNPLIQSSDSELFALYGSVMGELLRRHLVRTANAPAGDYAQYLVAKALGGELAPNSEKSWDVKTLEGKRVQVKGRVVANPPNQAQRHLRCSWQALVQAVPRLNGAGWHLPANRRACKSHVGAHAFAEGS
jgi:hypothetical protein